jgi:mitogen-activated protein kinase kinase kinase 3
MPAWWKGKGRSKSKGAAAGSVPVAAGGGDVKGAGRKKASSFDEAVLARGGRGKQAAAEVVGHLLPRPAFASAPLPSAPASASASSGGTSSLGSSAASDDPPDLGVYR